ncbi:YALIA101S04e14334g1_1 [Yarrowia lipolytica]|nr:YALIA101S04e14334g1_1 [Yarrowia lipolytica]
MTIHFTTMLRQIGRHSVGLRRYTTAGTRDSHVLTGSVYGTTEIDLFNRPTSTENDVKLEPSETAKVDGKVSMEPRIPNKLISQVRGLFPDRDSLHARVSLADSVGRTRIGIVPLGPQDMTVKKRKDANILNALLADPLASDQRWYDAFLARIASKDIVLSPGKYTGHGTQNSRWDMSLPSPFLKEVDVDIMEATSFADSLDNIRDCHWIIYVGEGEGLKAWPSVNLRDLAEDDFVAIVSATLTVNSEEAFEAVSLLRKSPSNSPKYLKLWQKSNFEQLSRAMKRMSANHDRALRYSIYQTCRDLCASDVSKESLMKGEADTIKTLRSEWSRNAHRELQTVLKQQLLKWRQSELPWYKLYWRIDDVDGITRDSLEYAFLPASRQSMCYLLGRIDGFACTTPNSPEPLTDGIYGLSPVEHWDSPSDDVIGQTLEELDDTLVSELHSRAYHEFLKVVLGIQLPTVIIPALGVYLYDLSLYNMGSIAAFGIVWGCFKLQKTWDALCSDFSVAVFEKARASINSCEQLIWSRWEGKAIEEKERVDDRKRLVAEMEESITQNK